MMNNDDIQREAAGLKAKDQAIAARIVDERRRAREYRAEDHYREYLGECSPEQRARAEWEQGS